MFDPKKADTIFTEEGEVIWTYNIKLKIFLYPVFSFIQLFIQTPAWLTEMIEHPTWRSLVYKLAEEYPDCLMLNFTIKVLIRNRIFPFYNMYNFRN